MTTEPQLGRYDELNLDVPVYRSMAPPEIDIRLRRMASRDGGGGPPSKKE